MENKTESLQFKTSINCGGCVTKVTPVLNQLAGVTSWSVDTENPDKILTVQSQGASVQDITAAIQKVGFTIESIA